ncbi:unnamed protein product [Heligmosomoides polygyrus]|uniref:Uncharacterized protein n=1 Tax=Heligmosomoides polygyrus TaxID=6339 RepID=A0A183G9K8_HELPZ|nr:unnamed protein product [Heligmosomoides polygyrus]
MLTYGWLLELIRVSSLVGSRKKLTSPGPPTKQVFPDCLSESIDAFGLENCAGLMRESLEHEVRNLL